MVKTFITPAKQHQPGVLGKLLHNALVERSALRRHEARVGRIEEVLVDGAAKARAFATPYLARIREAVGLRSLA